MIQTHSFRIRGSPAFIMSLCWAERELVLLKIRAPPGPTRTEVMQLIDIFRARVVDVSDRSLTIAVSGDAGKVPPTRLSC